MTAAAIVTRMSGDTLRAVQHPDRARGDAYINLGADARVRD
nr:hypothetical protein [Bradyrhizobium zhanjiangense]